LPTIFSEKKLNSSNFISTSKNALMIAIGGNDSILDNSPVCGGQYNTTDGGMVSFTYSI
jgi:hypothetical protein